MAGGETRLVCALCGCVIDPVDCVTVRGTTYHAFMRTCIACLRIKLEAERGRREAFAVMGEEVFRWLDKTRYDDEAHELAADLRAALDALMGSEVPRG